MFNCYTHGWSNLMNPCPLCFTTKTSTSSNATIQDIIQTLDGAAAVNLDEPSPGDLERVVNENRKLHAELTALKAKVEDAHKAFSKIAFLNDAQIFDAITIALDAREALKITRLKGCGE